MLIPHNIQLRFNEDTNNFEYISEKHEDFDKVCNQQNELMNELARGCASS